MKVKKEKRLATLGTRSWKFVILCIDDSAPLYIFLNKREEEGRALLIAAAKGSTCRTRWPSWSSPQERAASRFDTGSAAGACNTCLMRRRWLLLTLRCVHNDPLLYSLLSHFLWSLSVFFSAKETWSGSCRKGRVIWDQKRSRKDLTMRKRNPEGNRPERLISSCPSNFLVVVIFSYLDIHNDYDLHASCSPTVDCIMTCKTWWARIDIYSGIEGTSLSLWQGGLSLSLHGPPHFLPSFLHLIYRSWLTWARSPHRELAHAEREVRLGSRLWERETTGTPRSDSHLFFSSSLSSSEGSFASQSNQVGWYYYFGLWKRGGYISSTLL